ncbi:MAG: YgfZ/GcvT domain-containing protein [Pyrinomonadaceae bacterium]
MTDEFKKSYDHIRGGDTGFFEQSRGLIAVSGKEAVKFLNGLITNDVEKLADGEQMLAAFPNAQGRLLAVVRVIRQAERFLFESDEATRQKVFDYLFRFTYAGDFFVEELSGGMRFFSIFGKSFLPSTPPFIELENVYGSDYFVDAADADDFLTELTNIDAVKVSDELYETLRIESGIPLYGVDMDETTIVPELGIEGLVSYNKGCYIGQEIIARIHFRGHVAKQLTGVIWNDEAESDADEAVLVSSDGKNAGRITSRTFSRKLGREVALVFARYDYLVEGTELNAAGRPAKRKTLPIVR